MYSDYSFSKFFANLYCETTAKHSLCFNYVFVDILRHWINFIVHITRMKKTLLFIAVLFSFTFVQAQVGKSKDKEKPAKHVALTGQKLKRVPETVRLAFTKEFPNAEVNQWYRKDGTYRVGFRKNGQAHIAVYDKAGNRMD